MAPPISAGEKATGDAGVFLEVKKSVETAEVLGKRTSAALEMCIVKNGLARFCSRGFVFRNWGVIPARTHRARKCKPTSDLG